MKIWILLILIIPAANAIILLNDLESNVYNSGDKLKLEGYALLDKDKLIKFQTDLVCDDVTTLFIKSYYVKRGEKLNFSENLLLYNPSKKECEIIISLLDDSKVIDQTKSNTFKITNELIGNFSIKDNLIQVGKQIEIEGKISKLNNLPLNGLATILFIQGEQIFFTDTIEVKDGDFKYIRISSDNVPGDYSVDIEVNDVFNNKFVFEKVAKFTLINEISVIADVNKKSILPGTFVNIYGEANMVSREKVEEGDVDINFSNEMYNGNINNGVFDVKIKVPENIKTGKYQINVYVTDIFGNRGETITDLEVIPVSNQAELEFKKKTYLPGDVILFEPLLYDQGGDLLNEKLTVELINPQNEVVDEIYVNSNEESNFKLQEGTKSGVWKIKLTSNNLEDVKEFLVEGLADVEYDINGSILIVKNIGNNDYKEPINIKIIGDDLEKSLVKETIIKAEDEIEINLGREVETGKYDVSVDDKVFENVYITGSRKLVDLSALYYILIIFGIILFIYLLFFRTKRKILKRISEIIKKEKEEKEENLFKMFE